MSYSFAPIRHRYLRHLLVVIAVTAPWSNAVVHAAGRTGASDISNMRGNDGPKPSPSPAPSRNFTANPVVNRITGINLSTTTAAADSSVRVTVTGSGNCLTRIDNGGLQIIEDKSYVDLPGPFPKYVSLTVQGAPGTYTIQARNANPHDTSCSGSAFATLVVPGGTQNRNVVQPPANGQPPSPPPGGNTDTLAPAGASKSVAGKKKNDPYEPGQLVILWDQTADGIQGLEILARDFKVQPMQRVELGNLGGLLATFQLRDNKLASLLRDLLRQQYPGWHVDLHARYQSLQGARIYLPSKIDAPADISPLPKLRIGMLDTAVRTIPALQAVKLTQRSFLADTDTPTAHEHGTAIAALISGQDRTHRFRGMAPGAQLFAGAIMRDQEDHSGTNTAMLLRGLDWLIGNKVQVINLSLGGPGDDLMASVFAKLQKQGVIVVASAGNGGPDAPPSYPAAYRGVLAVTAVDALDQVYREANRGSYIAVAAPGVDIWTPDAAQGRYVSGTSFSAAVVTGAVGLMLSRKADLSADRVRENLCRHARDLGDPGADKVYGCGLLQLNRTLDALK